MLLSSALLTRPRAVAPTKRRSTRAFRACQWAILRDAGHGVQPGRACSSAGRSRQILSINGSGSAKGISLDIPFPAAGSRGSSTHLVAAGGGQDDGGAAGGGVGRRRSYLASCFWVGGLSRVRRRRWYPLETHFPGIDFLSVPPCFYSRKTDRQTLICAFSVLWAAN